MGVRTHFFETCNVRACGAFLSLRCAITTLHIFFRNNARYKEKNVLFFGVNYNSVAQKWKILAIKAIFDPKNPILTDSIDDRIKSNAEITNFSMRYCMNWIKLRLWLLVATIKKTYVPM